MTRVQSQSHEVGSGDKGLGLFCDAPTLYVCTYVCMYGYHIYQE